MLDLARACKSTDPASDDGTLVVVPDGDTSGNICREIFRHADPLQEASMRSDVIEMVEGGTMAVGVHQTCSGLSERFSHVTQS